MEPRKLGCFSGILLRCGGEYRHHHAGETRPLRVVWKIQKWEDQQETNMKRLIDDEMAFVPLCTNRSVGISRKNETERQETWLYDLQPWAYHLGVHAARVTCSAIIRAPQDMEEWNQVEARTMVERRKWVVYTPRQEQFLSKEQIDLFNLSGSTNTLGPGTQRLTSHSE